MECLKSILMDYKIRILLLGAAEEEACVKRFTTIADASTSDVDAVAVVCFTFNSLMQFMQFIQFMQCLEAEAEASPSSQLANLSQLYLKHGCSLLECEALSRMIRLSPSSYVSLRVLDVRFVSLQHLENMMPAIASEACSNLHVLTLSHSRFGLPAAVKVLADMLSCLKKLRHLDLSYSNLNDNSMVTLAPVLRNLTSLRRLNLFINEIACEGGRVLVNVLPHMRSLSYLDLGRNYIKSKKVMEDVESYVQIARFDEQQPSDEDEEDDDATSSNRG